MTHSVLLAGLGDVAMGYDLDMPVEQAVLTHARAFASHPAFDLVCGVDPARDRRDMFAGHYNVPARTDLADALDEFKPDIVVVAAPTNAHGAVLKSVLQHASSRALLCEKPLSNDIGEARDMVRMAGERSALYVNYLRRANPAAGEIKKRIEDGAIAGPVKGVAWYSKGLLNNGSHIVNLLEFWLGPVQGFKVIERGRLWAGTDPEPDVRIEFVRGSVTLLAAAEENFSLHEIDLIAANGRLRYAQGGGDISWQPAIADPLVEGYIVLARSGEVIASNTDMAQRYVADHLAAALAGKSSDLCSGADALTTLEWLVKIKDAS